MGGARPERSDKTSSRTAVSWGRESCQPVICGAEAIPLNETVSAGECSDWQTWQTVSFPFACWWRREPPAAKKSRTPQANTARVRRVLIRSKIVYQELIGRRFSLPRLTVERGSSCSVAKRSTGDRNIQAYQDKLHLKLTQGGIHLGRPQDS